MIYSTVDPTKILGAYDPHSMPYRAEGMDKRMSELVPRFVKTGWEQPVVTLITTIFDKDCFNFTDNCSPFQSLLLRLCSLLVSSFSGNTIETTIENNSPYVCHLPRHTQQRSALLRKFIVYLFEHLAQLAASG